MVSCFSINHVWPHLTSVTQGALPRRYHSSPICLLLDLLWGGMQCSSDLERGYARGKGYSALPPPPSPVPQQARGKSNSWVGPLCPCSSDKIKRVHWGSCCLVPPQLDASWEFKDCQISPKQPPTKKSVKPPIVHTCPTLYHREGIIICPKGLTYAPEHRDWLVLS